MGFVLNMLKNYGKLRRITVFEGQPRMDTKPTEMKPRMNANKHEWEADADEKAGIPVPAFLAVVAPCWIIPVIGV